MPDLGAVAPERIGERNLAPVLHALLVDPSVRAEHLGGRQLDGHARRAAHGKPGPPGEVLAEVVEVDARVGHRHVHGPVDLLDPQRRGRLRPERPARPGRHRRGRPGAVVETGLLPAGLFEAGVVVLPAPDRREQDRPARHAPALAAHHRRRRAVRVLDGEVEDQLRIAVGVVELGEAARLGRAGDVVHAVAEGDAERVGAPAQVCGDVVGGVEDGRPVVGPSRHQHIVRHLFSVDVQLVEPQPAHAHEGAAHRLFEVEVVAEEGKLVGLQAERGAREAVEPDPPRRRPRPHPPRRPRGGRAPGRRFAVAVPHPHGPVVRPPRLQRSALVRDEVGLLGRHPPAVPDVALPASEDVRRRRHKNPVGRLPSSTDVAAELPA